MQWNAIAGFTICIASLCFPPTIANAQTLLTCDDGAGCLCDAMGCCDSIAPTACSSCSFSTCDFLQGCGGCLAEHGITLNTTMTNFYSGVVAGGRTQDWSYAGHNDYVLNFDMGKMGIHDGLSLKVRLEHQYGQSINNDTGLLYPVNTPPVFPVPGDRGLYATDFFFTQLFGGNKGISIGKLNTFDGDQNAYASGRGVTQFSSVGNVVNPVLFRTVPYSTMGVSFFMLSDEGLPLTVFSVLDTIGRATESGFDELFGDGMVLVSETRLPTKFFSKPGHQLIGVTYSTRNFVALDQDGRLDLPSFPIQRESESWAFYWNMDQAVWVDPCNPTRHWGVYSRIGVADRATNPIQQFYAVGIGGSSPFKSRQYDRFGAGWSRTEISSDFVPNLTAILGPLPNPQNLEAFYNFAVNPNLGITLDYVYGIPLVQTQDDTHAISMRAALTF